MTNPDIFISYNREDAAIAQLYADAFTAAGLVVWWDATLRSGEDYDAVTEQALRTAKSVVVLWSPRSVNSRWVRAEATIADRGQRLMPVMIESCDRPIMFELKQTADLSHWRGDRDDKDWLSLVADVRRKIGLAPDSAPGTAPEVSAPAKSAAVVDDRAAVAVLPFGCRAGDDELALQAEDLTEDVTRELAYNRYFRVIAAGTMAAWRGKAIDHKEIGQKLKARYLVEGKLQRSGGNNRLTVQLVDGGTGNVLWSTRVLADLGDADMSAEALGAAVAAQLAEQIVQRVQALAMARSAPYSAWDHILRSAAFARRADEDGARLAVEEAKLAVAAGPEIGLAHATLASTLAAIQEAKGLDPDQDQTREIQARTRQAMRLDGNNPTVLMALAGAYRVLGDYEICLRLAKRSVELWPSSPMSYMILGDSYRMLGRTADAIEAYHKQERLAPFDSSRHLALTYLGMSLVIEDKVEEAEIALDRALTLDPENPVALGWKAIAAERLGKNRIALETVRQIRSPEAAMLLDRHVLQIEHNEYLRERTAEQLRTLGRLRRSAGTEGAEPVEVESETDVLAEAGSLDEPVALCDAPAPEAVPSEDPGARQLEAADETLVASTATVEAKAETPAPPGGDAADPPADRPPERVEPAPLMFAEPPADEAALQVPDSETRAAEAAEYLVAIPDDAKPASAKPEPVNFDSSTINTAPRKAVLPRLAAMAGVVAVVGAGAVMWGGGADQPAGTTQAPAIELAALPAAAGVAAGPAAATSTAPHPLTAAIGDLIAASRSARRPQAELAALEAGQQELAALLAQSTADPANAALAGQLNAVAAGLAQQQSSALSLDADRWFKTQEQAAAAARRQLTPEGAATVDRALNKARSARADLAAATTNAASAPDAMKSLAAARLAFARYGKLVASPVAPAIASARSAEADAGRVQERLSRSRTEIETARVEVGRQSAQVAGLAAVEKPGLFASTARRESFKLRKANAERARTVAAEADRIASQSAAITGPGELKSSLSRLRGLKSQLAELLAASNAALKSGAEPEKKATATERK